MARPPIMNSQCPAHPDEPVSAACARCGGFFCTHCLGDRLAGAPACHPCWLAEQASTQAVQQARLLRWAGACLAVPVAFGVVRVLARAWSDHDFRPGVLLVGGLLVLGAVLAALVVATRSLGLARVTVAYEVLLALLATATPGPGLVLWWGCPLAAWYLLRRAQRSTAV